ncbi:ornithine cyclodeaminase family protein [Actinomadura nitritigenes]|uniref:Ornithine cyclodeaminase family protein n=1 Tax=Actinomadura nitritigenes TaxID=134602 RepID=A0ABS3QQI8_9ACTN|nr:ornithine cyclodeaminase family protein [Actinomadura nitritigenes]MBO2436249.1 ornithine cyclodeaminase family protein [Actinomadura nitritigenes]
MLVLSRRDVEELLDVDALIDSLAPAMADLSAGRAHVPERTAAAVPGRDALLLDMPGHAPSADALVSKLVSVFPGNAGSALPVRQAVIVAFDPATGEPAALLDGTHITAVRTAACAALSARLLARDDASVVAVLGTGVQARAHAIAVPRVRDVREVRIAGRDHARAVKLAEELSDAVDADVRAVAGYEEAVAGAAIVSAATYAVEPVVRREWLAPGTHVTSIGYNPRGREVDDATVADAALFVESRAAALSAVPPNLDLAEPLERGVITPEHVRAELGEVIEGTRPGRTSAEEITLYKSVGVVVQDLAATALVLREARRRGAGTEVGL